MSTSPFTSIRADESVLREIFNAGRFPERVTIGEIKVKITRSRPVPAEKNIRGWILGTMSQELRYYDQDDHLIAKTHRYLRPDGLLAASGKEDPKRVVKDGVMYIRSEAEEQ